MISIQDTRDIRSQLSDARCNGTLSTSPLSVMQHAYNIFSEGPSPFAIVDVCSSCCVETAYNDDGGVLLIDGMGRLRGIACIGRDLCPDTILPISKFNLASGNMLCISSAAAESLVDSVDCGSVDVDTLTPEV